MAFAEATGPAEPAPARRGISPLPFLTAVNFFTYVDRQVVYSMTPFVAKTFDLSKFQLGLLSLVNLGVFALASLASGPIADRFGTRRLIFWGILVWSIATIGSATSVSFPMLLAFRALGGVGEGAYGPSANALLCADAPPKQRGRALGIYNAGMAIGGSAGLFLGAVLSPMVGWRGALWVAAAPSVVLAALAAFLKAPARIERPKALPARSYLTNPTYVVALAGGILVTFAVSALVFWARWLVIDERGFSVVGGSAMMLCIGVFGGIGGVISGGIIGDKVGHHRPGGHALVVGVSLILAIPMGLGGLLVKSNWAFPFLTVATVFLLSIYQGPSVVIVDQLAPPQYAATLQAVFLFGIHVLGDAPAGSVVGLIGAHTTVAHSLLITVVAFGISGLLFLYVARRQHREAPT